MCGLYTCISLDIMAGLVVPSCVWAVYMHITRCHVMAGLMVTSCVWAVYMHITRYHGRFGGSILCVGCIHAYH